MEEGSWRRNHGGRIMEEKSWRRNPGAASAQKFVTVNAWAPRFEIIQSEESPPEPLQLKNCL